METVQKTKIMIQETLEESSEKWFKNKFNQKSYSFMDAIEFGSKWQQERSYSEEEVIDIAKQAYSMGRSNYTIKAFNAWFKQFKKTL